ncbi:Tannase/feruloyl esterase [Hypoxylon sp. FL1857]|nr:Tannase/feruloyl esterase [Hypoxylon sp. FL1857]
MDLISIAPALCAPCAFSTPAIFGTEFLSLSTQLVQNFSRYVSDQDYIHHPETFVKDAAFCNITVTYTHPGQGDTVIAEAWLPLLWNGRLQAVGSGGWTAGRSDLASSMMSGAVGEGYATITTDAGLGSAQSPHGWALLSPGNVNWNALHNLGSVSLYEQALIGKHLIKSFYGQPPKFSYFNGCSQGGRQGLQLAQRYPDAYDGIAASAPAVYWPQFFQAMLWPQMVMKTLGQYPHGCELDFLQSAAINHCDANDGIVDGIIADPNSCQFDPFELVDTLFYCNETRSDMRLSQAAAEVAAAYHTGARAPDGKFLWYGPYWGANFTRTIFGSPGLAATACDEKGTSCKGLPFPFALLWMKFFAMKDPKWDFASMTPRDFAQTFHLVAQEYASIYGTADPDLSLFRDAGGKMITYHGLADDITPAAGTERYYNEATKVTPELRDFYRYFEVPGLGHCYGGNGGHPSNVFEALRAWVENGTTPDNIPIDVPRHGPSRRRILCPYPERMRLRTNKDSDGDGLSDFQCSA